MLWGESGNGKSHLARKIAERRWGAGQVAFLQGPAKADSLFDIGMSSVLQGAGIEVSSWNWAAKLAALRTLIRSGARYSAIVLDDIDETAAQSLLGDSPAIPVIITTGERFRSVSGTEIMVSGFTGSEAVEAFGPLADDVESGHVTELCQLLGHRPIAIALARSLIMKSLTSFEDLLRMCRNETSTVLNASHDLGPQGRSGPLTRVYQELTMRLTVDFVVEAAVLALVWITKSTEEEYLEHAVAELTDIHFADFRIKASIAKLESFSLLERRGSTLLVNELSVDLIRGATAPKLEGLLRLVYDRADASARWWAGKDRAIPTSISAFGQGQTLGYARARAKYLYPSLDFGVFSISANSMIAWQRGVRIFSAPEGGLKLALLDSSFGRGRIYVPGERPQEVLEEYPSEHLRREKLVLFCISTLEMMYSSSAVFWNPHDASIREYDADNKKLVKIDGKVQPLSLAVGSPSKFKHTLLAPDRLFEVLKPFQPSMWAVCGGLYNLADFDVVEPDCPACLRGVDVTDSLGSRSMEVGLTARLLRFVGADASQAAVFHTEAAALTIWLLLEDYKNAAESAERSVAALERLLAPQEEAKT